MGMKTNTLGKTNVKTTQTMKFYPKRAKVVNKLKNYFKCVL